MENSSNGAHKKEEVVPPPEDETNVNDDNLLNIVEERIEMTKKESPGKPVCVLFFRESSGCSSHVTGLHLLSC